MDIKIPNLGEGIESATVISILVSPGESVTKDQTLIELETDKAVAPVPSPSAGEIGTITVKEGDVVKTGSLIGNYSGGSNGDSGAQESSESAPAAAPAPVAVQNVPVPVQPLPTVPVPQIPSGGVVPPCSPSMKKLAHRIGLDLSRINPTGKSGRLTDQDVYNYVQYLQSLALNPQQGQQQVVEAQKPAKKPLPDFSKFGDVEIKKLSSLRQKISEKMEECWTTIPHVTQQQQIDITDLMALRKKFNPKYKKKKHKNNINRICTSCSSKST